MNLKINTLSLLQKFLWIFSELPVILLSKGTTCPLTWRGCHLSMNPTEQTDVL
jgi:hypothetical protein